MGPDPRWAMPRDGEEVVDVHETRTNRERFCEREVTVRMREMYPRDPHGLAARMAEDRRQHYGPPVGFLSDHEIRQEAMKAVSAGLDVPRHLLDPTPVEFTPSDPPRGEAGATETFRLTPSGAAAVGEDRDDGLVPVTGWTQDGPISLHIGDPEPVTRELDVFLDGEPLARLNLTAGTVAHMADEARAAEVLLAELLEEVVDLSEGGVLDLRESVFAEAPVVLFPDGTWDLVPIDGQEPYQPDEASRSFWSAVGAAFAAVPGWAWRRS